MNLMKKGLNLQWRVSQKGWESVKRQYIQYLKSLSTECEIDKNEIYDPIENGIIDLESLVREYILLDMPPYPQCEPSCEDDSEIEKHSNDGIDPRWQQLLQIKN